MEDRQRVVAVGLLTERDLSILGQGFKRVYHLDESDHFQALLAAIDAAEQDYKDGLAVEAPASNGRSGVRPAIG